MDTKSLTGLRFFAALIVINFHYGKETEFTNLARKFLLSGQMMVTFFFVLSGFVLTFSYLKRDSFSTCSFFVARISRIFPLYFLALAVPTVFHFSTESFTFSSLLEVILTGTFLQAWFPPYALALNGPAWAISVQVFFYLFFPVIIEYLRKISPKVSSLWIVSIGVYLVTQLVLINLLNLDTYKAALPTSHSLIFYFPLAHFNSFLLGVAAGYHVQRVAFNRGNKLLWTALNGMFLLFLFYELNTRFLSRIAGYRIPADSSFLAPLFVILILLFINEKNLIRLVFQTKPIMVLGEASYALYIFQDPLYKLYGRFIHPVLGLEGDPSFFLMVLLMVIASVVLHYGFELPANNWIRNLGRRAQSNPSQLSV